jgi:hypothetical protein
MDPLTIAVIVIAVVAVGAIASTAPTPFFSPPTFFLPGNVVGSGNLVTQQENFTGFSAVSMSSGFRFTITQSSTYSVRVTIDNNLVNYVEVTQARNTLSVGFVPGRSYQSTSPIVVITMPDMSRLDMSAGVTGTVTGFSSSHEFTVASSAGSVVTISGAASSLSIEASAGSRLDLSAFHVTNASVNLSGGAEATINLDGRLDANVSGGSQLYYVGNPTMGSISSSGGSVISRK